MPKVLIIADDLTGALDAAAQFANQNIPSYVAASADCDLAARFGEFDVVSVNAESRHLRPEQAAAVVRELAERGQQAGVEYSYKKTDSTLRGNLGAELNALRVAVGHGRLAFVPA